MVVDDIANYLMNFSTTEVDKIKANEFIENIVVKFIVDIENM